MSWELGGEISRVLLAALGFFWGGWELFSRLWLMDYLGSCCDGDLGYMLHLTGNEWYLFDRFHRSIW